jgi:hypothetical protein
LFRGQFAAELSRPGFAIHPGNMAGKEEEVSGADIGYKRGYRRRWRGQGDVCKDSILL